MWPTSAANQSSRHQPKVLASRSVSACGRCAQGAPGGGCGGAASCAACATSSAGSSSTAASFGPAALSAPGGELIGGVRVGVLTRTALRFSTRTPSARCVSRASSET
eukprot:5735342-Prymnesium_polylepis.1